MTEIEKLVAFVEQTICCGDACLCPGGDCFQSMERGKAVAVIRRTMGDLRRARATLEGRDG